ncbi:hypothetical protein KEM54_005890 [Ascosphaera aggregata]|nr:hypothetical protein KEM54_005890 [Ascosphaera aggregata]
MISRRMLSKDEEAQAEDTEVRKEDQEKINRFSTLHHREMVLEGRLKAKNVGVHFIPAAGTCLARAERIKDKEDLEEVSMELELADEDELVPYKIGDSFFNLPLEEAQTLLASSTEKLTSVVSALEDEMSDIKDELQRLKIELYARFGKGINLD